MPPAASREPPRNEDLGIGKGYSATYRGDLPRWYIGGDLMSDVAVVTHFGAVAQLGEHRLCKPGVVGSSPIISTIGL